MISQFRELLACRVSKLQGSGAETLADLSLIDISVNEKSVQALADSVSHATLDTLKWVADKLIIGTWAGCSWTDSVIASSKSEAQEAVPRLRKILRLDPSLVQKREEILRLERSTAMGRLR